MSGLPSEHEPYVERIDEGIYAYIQPEGGWCVSNAGFLIGRDAVILIDTAATLRRASLLKEAITARTSAPVRLLINTHHHGDHTFGNQVFSDTALVLGHQASRAEQLKAGFGMLERWPLVNFGPIRLEPAMMTYSQSMTICLDDKSIDLLHFGVAHTVGDTVVWIASDRTLFTGDIVFSGSTPYCINGSCAGTIHALEKLVALEPKIVVAGHGPVRDAAVLHENIAYLRWVQDLAARSSAAGLTPLEAARSADLSPWRALTQSERLVANLWQAYSETPANQSGGEFVVDVEQVRSEMADFNGKPIVTSA